LAPNGHPLPYQSPLYHLLQVVGPPLILSCFNATTSVTSMAKQCCRMIALALICGIPKRCSAAGIEELACGTQKKALLTEPFLASIHNSTDQLLGVVQHKVQQPAAPGQAKTGKKQNDRRKYKSGTAFAVGILGAAIVLPSAPRMAVYVSF